VHLVFRENSKQIKSLHFLEAGKNDLAIANNIVGQNNLIRNTYDKCVYIHLIIRYIS